MRALTGTPSHRGAGSPATCVVLLLAGALALVLAACSGNSDATDAAVTSTTGQGATTTSTSTATTATTEDVETAVLAAYRASWADVVAVGKTADWQSPRLAAHTTGQALQRLRTHFRNLKTFGLITLGTVKLNPRVTTLRGRTAVVEDCVDVSRFLLHDAKTRQPREKPDLRPNAGVATLVLTADGWKVSKTVGRGKCAG